MGLIMEKDTKKLINEVGSLKNGEKILRNLGKLKSFAVSPQGKQMISSLGPGGAGLADRVSSDIQKGDLRSAAELLRLLTSTNEGRALLDKVVNMTGIK